MSYFIRLFSKSSLAVSVDQLRCALPGGITLHVVDGIPGSWNKLLVMTKDGRDVCLIERNAVEHDGIAAEEIQEFIEFQRDAKPQSAADWVKSYLMECCTVYACQF